MKDRYHIKIDGDHIEQFKNVMSQMGIECEFGCSLNEFGRTIEADFIVELSKYELLYIRLACQSGKIINLKSEVW